MALRLNEDGRYIGDSLCLSPVVWSIFKLHNDCENTDLLTLLSSENYLNDISELENNLFLETENGAPMTFADAYKITRNQYGKYISENFRQDKYVVVFRLFESAEYMEKFGENDILSLCKSYYATDISMVSEALKQNILKPEMVKYCNILNSEEENRRDRTDLVSGSHEKVKKALDEILDINNAPLGK